MDLQYTYAVARVRAKEVTLFNAAVIDQLLACRNYEQCLQFLIEKGWGDADTPLEAEAILACESEKTWAEVRDLVKDMSVFEVLNYPNLFHNLKAAIKLVCSGSERTDVFYPDTVPSSAFLLEKVKERAFGDLPVMMAKPAEEAYEALLHGRDGQLCDMIIDKACLQAIRQAGKESGEEVIRSYSDSYVAIADIKIAVRCAKTGKSADFTKRALADCASLSTEALARAAANGVDAIREYLKTTAYAGAAEALEQSPSVFERWCDDRIIDSVRPQKYESFSVGPVVAYALARENEIKTVRIILSGRLNGLSVASIRERVRKMYV
ncbi:MAG: V-type ATPase subunit [Eubacteriales bacterium]|nr:V-type ATPase subunit [Eubacteriales bacterium]